MIQHHLSCKSTAFFLLALVFLSRPDFASGLELPQSQGGELERAHEYSNTVLPLVIEVKEKNIPSENPLLKKRPFFLNNSLYEFLLLKLDQKFYFLDSPIIKKEEDLYQPVRFMHAKHAALTQDCDVCHHAAPANAKDFDATRCSACHQESFNKTVLGRLGLKGAYHRQCLNCHKESQTPNAPTDCIGCHGRNVPDHNELVELPVNPTPFEVTEECLRCHETQGEEFVKTSHWLWKSPLGRSEGRNGNAYGGKAALAMNNSCIALPGNWENCTNCHCGYGWDKKDFDFSQKNRIDCLVCHDTTGLYAKDPNGAGMPVKDLDLVKIAKNVGKPTRETCGTCHLQHDTTDPTQHAYMNGGLEKPKREFDIHMGGYDMQCQDCHRTRQHRIPGEGSSHTANEGTFSCEACHTFAPHTQGPLIYHLNNHSKNVACTTCHSPLYAKSSPTKIGWDWSKAGDKNRTPKIDEDGRADYDWRFGEFTWRKNIKPQYAWYSGEMRSYNLGDVFDPTQVLHITEPIGSIHDPNSKIFPFQVLRGKQPADGKNNMLLVPQLSGKDGYWETLDWGRALESGMKQAEMKTPESYRWQETVMLWRAEHEVMPREYALPCSQCHTSLKTERTCDRCHKASNSLDYKALSNQGYEFKDHLELKGGDVAEWYNGEDYIDFKKLGYKGDPIEVGGRFKILPLGSDSPEVKSE